MSKNPTPTHTNPSTTANKLAPGAINQVKEAVAETVEQLVTTNQEKPQTQATPQTAPQELPKYDADYVKTLNVSGAVRYLFGLGFTRGQIVKEFPKAKGRPILYQHVRNVLVTPVKQGAQASASPQPQAKPQS